MSSRTVVRSAKVPIGHANAGKRAWLQKFVAEYRNGLQSGIDQFFDAPLLPKHVSKEIYRKIPMRIAQMSQCVGRQAFDMLRKFRDNHDRNGFAEGREVRLSAANERPIIDQRNAKIVIREPNGRRADSAIRIQCGVKDGVWVPFRASKHIRRFLAEGFSVCNSVRVEPGFFVLTFKKVVPIKEGGSPVGIDIGLNAPFTMSNGVVARDGLDGHTLKSVCERLARRKPGSRGFAKAQAHRKNLVGYMVNRAGIEAESEIRVEDMTGYKKGRRLRPTLRHWPRTDIHKRLVSIAERTGARVLQVAAAYTSQRCSGCGWVEKANRNGAGFECRKCGFVLHADLNAARNIALGLQPVGAGMKGANVIGFYWCLERSERNPDCSGSGRNAVLSGP